MIFYCHESNYHLCKRGFSLQISCDYLHYQSDWLIILNLLTNQKILSVVDLIFDKFNRIRQYHFIYYVIIDEIDDIMKFNL